jgi:hypothetical protein
MTVAAIRTQLHMEPTEPKTKLKRVAMVYGLVSSPAGYRLMRAHREFATVVDRKTHQLIDDAVEMKANHPELAAECDEVLNVMRRTLSKSWAVMRRRYNFRPVLRAPIHYHDEF